MFACEVCGNIHGASPLRVRSGLTMALCGICREHIKATHEKVIKDYGEK